jgi:hypothetical protein
VAVTRQALTPTLRVTGEITISNRQMVPYVLGAMRLALFRARTGANTDPFGYAEVNCPKLSGRILVGPQLLRNKPGTLVCTFDIPEPTGDPAAVGGVQVQAKTLLSETFDIDSGAPRPYDLAGGSVQETNVGSCATMLGSYLAGAPDLGNSSSRGSSSGRAQSNSTPSASTSSSSSSSDGKVEGSSDAFKNVPFLEPVRLAAGSMPRASGSALLPTIPICGSRNFTWTAEYGPLVAQDACGGYLVSHGSLSLSHGSIGVHPISG